jgi:hypothetical protein
MNKKYCGIFINDTTDNIKLQTNINNINNLKDNFNSIIIIDSLNNYSKDFKNIVKNMFLNDDILINIYLLNDIPYGKIDKWQYALINIEMNKYDYLVFVDDNYIYCDKLLDYFYYLDNNDLNICSYNDSTNKEYHLDLYLFTISTSNIYEFNNFIIKMKKPTSEKINPKEIYNNILYNTLDYLSHDKNIPFLKIGNIDTNKNKNIFFTTDYLYQHLMETNELPIINIDAIKVEKTDDKFIIFDELPPDFDVNFYKDNNSDLSSYDDKFLEDHFLQFGQFENRKYKDFDSIFYLEIFIRDKLKSCNLLQYFDFPDNFNIHNYKRLNPDLNHFNNNDLINHWFNYGIYENRKYN